jgi:ABC-type glycerol-3-phosphate transport system substrate-binding protein
MKILKGKWILLAVVLLLAFAACTGRDANPEPTQAPADTSGTNVNEGDTSGLQAPVIDPTEVVGSVVAPLENLSGNLNVWSFSNEALVLATAFQEKHPELNVNFRMASMEDGSYQEMVAMALASGTSDAPDVVFLEVGFVRTFVDDGWLRDLSAFLPNAVDLETIPFTVQAGTDSAGAVRAFSFQATPGAMFYRRSMAQRYFGTDDPAALQPRFANLDLFMEAARSIHEQSGGSTRIVSSPTEVYRAFLPNRTQPWVVNNTLTIDPIMLDYMSFAYELRNEGMDAQAGQWSGEWAQAMQDNLHDAAGNRIDVFSFFMPTWGLPFVIMGHAEEHTFGDWGIIPGPLPYQWGGTWLGVTQVANNTEAAMEFLRFATLDEQHLTNWATGVYTNEFLSAALADIDMDGDIPEGLSQGAGDLVSSARLIRTLAPQVATSRSAEFIGGQNPYDVFGEAALAVRFGLQQGTDNTIGDAFINAVDLYITGQADRDATLESFRQDVQMALPNLNW